MTKKQTKILIAVLAVLLLAGGTVYAVTGYGTETDPLITKSYLDGVLQPKLESELKEQVASAKAQMHSSVPGEFTELSLSGGQSLRCGAGCQLLLRSGSAAAAGDTGTALLDTTGGSGVGAGAALTANHLYMAAAEGSGLTAGSGGATLMVSGTYSLQ